MQKEDDVLIELLDNLSNEDVVRDIQKAGALDPSIKGII
jgi:hypothetical protein